MEDDTGHIVPPGSNVFGSDFLCTSDDDRTILLI